MSIQNQVASKTALTVIASIAWLGLLLQFWLSINLTFANGNTALNGIIVFFGFFTVLTNLFVALTATLPLIASRSSIGRWFGTPMVLGCATTSIIMVGLTYHLLLRHIWQPQGLQLLADMVLHYVVPILAFVYWLAFTPRIKFGVFTPLVWCLYPLGYLVYVLIRGELLGSYPYYFIDVTSLGYDQVMLNSVGLLVAFIVVAILVLAIATLRNRFRAP